MKIQLSEDEDNDRVYKILAIVCSIIDSFFICAVLLSGWAGAAQLAAIGGILLCTFFIVAMGIFIIDEY